MAEHGGEHRRDLDHPGDRAPEEMGQTLERADAMLGKRVLAILGEPPRRLGFRQPAGVGRGAGGRILAVFGLLQLLLCHDGLLTVS